MAVLRGIYYQRNVLMKKKLTEIGLTLKFLQSMQR